MCCCGKPTINGEMGYRWQPNDPPSVREPAPPKLQDGDVLLYDEPGRCGGLDCHCHHFRVVKDSVFEYLLVRHGGGQERIRLGCTFRLMNLDKNFMSSNTRYWLLYTIYSAHQDGATNARHSEHSRWTHAVAEKRVKTRKLPKRGVIRVWIEPEAAIGATQEAI